MSKASKYPPQFKATLPTTEVDAPDGGKKTRHIGAEIVTIVMKQPSGQNGVDINDMVKRWPIVSRLEADPTELNMNEQERTLVLDLFKSFRFSVVDKSIIDTYNAIVNAESCTLAAV